MDLSDFAPIFRRDSTTLHSCIDTRCPPRRMYSRNSTEKPVFSHIDFADAYLQVKVDDSSIELLTINTLRRLYRYNHLSFGVKSAPGIFQQIIASMITGLDGFLNTTSIWKPCFQGYPPTTSVSKSTSATSWCFESPILET